MENKNVHLLPTDKPTWLHKSTLTGILRKSSSCTNEMRHSQGMNIYITNDEEIKMGEECYYLYGNEVKKNQNNTKPHSFCKKIILTTDEQLIKDGVQSIPDEFLEWFVNNSSCEDIKTELVPVNEFGSEITVNGYGFDKFKYKIIIPKEEPKQEIWKDIPNYEGLYQVSNFGNVKSLERYVKGKIENRLQKENILSKRLVGDKGNQYYAVTLCNNKDRKQVKVSVLVAMAFLNHIPNGYVGFTVDHIDNNPLNNNVNNLQVITKRENSSKDRKGISKYTGVTFNKKSNKWRSQIWIDGKNKTLGSFDDELEAHRAYQKELQQHLKY